MSLGGIDDEAPVYPRADGAGWNRGAGWPPIFLYAGVGALLRGLPFSAIVRYQDDVAWVDMECEFRPLSDGAARGQVGAQHNAARQ